MWWPYNKPAACRIRQIGQLKNRAQAYQMNWPLAIPASAFRPSDSRAYWDEKAKHVVYRVVQKTKLKDMREHSLQSAQREPSFFEPPEPPLDHEWGMGSAILHSARILTCQGRRCYPGYHGQLRVGVQQRLSCGAQWQDEAGSKLGQCFIASRCSAQ